MFALFFVTFHSFSQTYFLQNNFWVDDVIKVMSRLVFIETVFIVIQILHISLLSNLNYCITKTSRDVIQLNSDPNKCPKFSKVALTNLKIEKLAFSQYSNFKLSSMQCLRLKLTQCQIGLKRKHFFLTKIDLSRRTT